MFWSAMERHARARCLHKYATYATQQPSDREHKKTTARMNATAGGGKGAETRRKASRKEDVEVGEDANCMRRSDDGLVYKWRAHTEEECDGEQQGGRAERLWINWSVGLIGLAG